MLEHFAIGQLTTVPIRLHGEWQKGKDGQWEGAAESAVPIASIVFLTNGSFCAWCKSDKISESLRVSFKVFPHEKEGKEFHISFFAGGGGRQFCVEIEPPGNDPKIHAPRLVPTGKLVRFAAVGGEDRIDAYVLFIARDDLKVGRKRLWRVRKSVAAGLHEPFRTWLTHGRTGAFDLSE